MQPRHSSCGLPVAIRKEILVTDPTIETLARRLDRVEREKQRRNTVWETLTAEEKATTPNVVPLCFPGTFDPRGK